MPQMAPPSLSLHLGSRFSRSKTRRPLKRSVFPYPAPTGVLGCLAANPLLSFLQARYHTRLNKLENLMANKLELTWIDKDKPTRVEPRLLIENTSQSNTKAAPDTENMLIHRDNLLALKSLEAKYASKVKCIYIDPPYNTGAAFEHYDDNLEHSIWLGLMKARLEILRNLLADDGFLCCHITLTFAGGLSPACLHTTITPSPSLTAPGEGVIVVWRRGESNPCPGHC